MKITTRVQLKWDDQAGRYFADPETWEGYEYSGPVEECKGEGHAQYQLDKQNALQQDAYNSLKAKQAQVSDAVSKYLRGNVGFDPQQLALLKSQFLNSNAQNYQTAGANVRTALLRTGSADGNAPVGGDYVRGVAGLEGGLASSTSSGLTGIDLQNLSQALNNKFNAANLINGQAATLTSPIVTFGAGASNALNQYMQASNSGFGAMFMRGLGSGLGQGVAQGAIGGFGSLASGFGSTANKNPNSPSGGLGITGSD